MTRIHVWLSWAAAMFLTAGTVTATRSAAPQGPSVIFILADDLGWGDLRCYGNPVVDTPALDALAAGGVRFTAHYSPSSLCAPARAGYLTGRYNHRTGAVDVPSNRGLDRLAPGELTLGDYFRHAGYATALMGKWHNGAYSREQLPHRRGFDLFVGYPNGGQDYWRWNLVRNDEPFLHDGRYLSDAIADEAIQFVRAQRGRPFALFLAHPAPHGPLQAPAPLVAKYRDRLGPGGSEAVVLTYAMIEAMDAGLERLFQALRDEGRWEDTIIVFTSDNGPVLRRDPSRGPQQRFNGPFSGEKESVLEGGIRVPGIVSWPGRIAGGRVETTPVHGCDWLPTLYGLTGQAAPTGAKPLDGIDLLPLLEGRPWPVGAEREIPFQRNRYAPVAGSNAAIRAGRWKLYWPGLESTMLKDATRDNPSYQRGLVRPPWEMPLDAQLDVVATTAPRSPRLFDLETDPGEERDLAALHPEIVARLAARHAAWFAPLGEQWREARAQIVAQDQEYWRTRPVPDARELFRDFWLWSLAPPGTDPKTADPLTVFRGYWTAREEVR
jgi:arylsulfatase A-like enzyme